MFFYAVYCTLLLLTASGVCFGQELVLPASIKGAVGGKVVITPTRIPNPPYLFIRWSFNKTNILLGPPSGIIILAPYRDRVSLDHSTYALELRNLVESDTGLYSLSIETESNPISGQTSLYVLVPVSNVTIVPSQTELVEFNSTVSLNCSASGSSLSYLWLNGSTEVTADNRIQLTNNNSSLKITSVIRGDTGPYKCEASNLLGKETSPELSLTIYYGPENVAIVSDPVDPIFSSGSNPKLICSARSNPDAEFQWAVNETHLGETGSELKLNNIQISQSGNYTCIAHNKQTLRYSISEPISITVQEFEEQAGSSLSAGVIAAIVIVVLLCVGAAVAGLVIFIMKDKQQLGICSSGNKKNGESGNNGQQDLNYADIHHFQQNQGQPGIAGMPPGRTPQSNKNATIDSTAVIYSDLKNV